MILRLILIISAVIELAPLSARAACSNTRLDQGQGALAKVTVKDQLDLGVCYSYAAAELLDAYQYSHDPSYKDQTSGVDLAFTARTDYSTREKAEKPGTRLPPVGYGNPVEAIQQAVTQGTCSESQVISGLSYDSTSRRSTESAFLVRLADYFQAYRSYAALHSTESDLLKKRLDHDAVGLACFLMDQNVALTELPSIDSLKTLLVQNDEKTFIQSVISSKCLPAKRRIPKVCPQAKVIGSDDHAKAAIENLFSGTAPLQPTALGFCVNRLTPAYNKASWRPPTRHPGSPGIPETNDMDESSCGAHWAVAAGMREVNGKCEVLIRNSWGKSCDYYSPEFSDPDHCEGGSVWVPEDVLAPNLFATSWIEDCAPEAPAGG
jgi:hypothetical protein